MGLEALVHVHEHGRQALERARTRERARIDRTPERDPAGELEREGLRLVIVAADESVLIGRFLAAESSRSQRM